MSADLLLRLIVFVLPLALDSFAVAAALGAAGPLPGRQRLSISLVFLVFEGGMPVLGLAAGAPLAHAVGRSADYLAAAVVIGIGIWMSAHTESGEEDRAAGLTTAHGLAIIGLGIGISLDELAIGFGLGLTGLPIVPVVIAIAAQALLATQVGLSVGARIGERFREAAERVAGVALIALGLFLAAERLLQP